MVGWLNLSLWNFMRLITNQEVLCVAGAWELTIFELEKLANFNSQSHTQEEQAAFDHSFWKGVEARYYQERNSVPNN